MSHLRLTQLVRHSDDELYARGKKAIILHNFGAYLINVAIFSDCLVEKEIRKKAKAVGANAYEPSGSKINFTKEYFGSYCFYKIDESALGGNGQLELAFWD